MQLKAFIADYTFRDEVEEIEFFKTVKPRICHRLIYYRKIYNIEMNRPVGSESQRSYLIDEIRGINRYNEKRSDFVRYYRSGLTHLDALYYLRGNLTRHSTWSRSITSVIRLSRPTVTSWRHGFLPTSG